MSNAVITLTHNGPYLADGPGAQTVEAGEAASLLRLEMFSDAVFAIAITLLTLDLALPPSTHDLGGRSLLSAMGHLWPSYLAYVTSFATILIMWFNHHGFCRTVKRLDPVLVLTNGFLLLIVAATPFPTRILAEYINTPAAGTACAIYAGYFLLCNVGFLAFWWSIRYRRRLLKDTVDETSARTVSRSVALGFVLYLLAIGTALVSAVASLMVITGLWIFWSWLAYARSR
jgi:uncharacterized membrane protein